MVSPTKKKHVFTQIMPWPINTCFQKNVFTKKINVFNKTKNCPMTYSMGWPYTRSNLLLVWYNGPVLYEITPRQMRTLCAWECCWNERYRNSTFVLDHCLLVSMDTTCLFLQLWLEWKVQQKIKVCLWCTYSVVSDVAVV